MELKEAINSSQIWAVRGYDKDGKCVVSIAYYGDQLMWLPGFGGNWKKWEPIPEDEKHKLDGLNFLPSGPRPSDQIEQEIKDAISEIIKDDDEFEPGVDDERN